MADMDKIEMAGVREYAEEMPVELVTTKNRLAVKAFNEAGYNCTEVDLLDLLAWVKANRPEVWEAASR